MLLWAREGDAVHSNHFITFLPYGHRLGPLLPRKDRSFVLGDTPHDPVMTRTRLSMACRGTMTRSLVRIRACQGTSHLPKTPSRTTHEHLTTTFSFQSQTCSSLLPSSSSLRPSLPSPPALARRPAALSAARTSRTRAKLVRSPRA
jgi:hypothetical protein